MRILSYTELQTIAGGENNFIVKQQISIDGISPACIKTLTQFDKNRPEEEMLRIILGSCTIVELDLLDERMDSTPARSISMVR